jgi:long-chain acyl-CoA synthetase
MRFPSLIHDYLERACERCPEKNFLICGPDRVSYRQVYLQSRRLARGLIERGLTLHDRVLILVDNAPETVIAMYAIARAGGTFVIANGTVKASKLRYLLANSGAGVLIAQTGKLRVVKQALRGLKPPPEVIWVHPARSAGPFPDACAGDIRWEALLDGWETDAPGPAFPRIIDQDLAALVYTSGSAGEAKGVMQPHDRMIRVAQSIIQYLGNTEEDVILNVLPLSFGYGLYQVLMAAMFGGTVVLEKSFVYLKSVLARIPDCRVTGFPIVPTIMAMLFQFQNVERFDFSSLRYITVAGDAMPAAPVRRFRELWPRVSIYLMYGLTECVRVCYLDPGDVDRSPESVGTEIPNCRTLIVDENDVPVAPNRIGQLVVIGSNVMAGYWRDADLTKRVFRPGPEPGQTRLYTGDLFRRDEQGLLYFVARRDDMIKCRGERVSPREVEKILLRMEAVAEAAVVGVPDDVLGQAIRAFIVPRPRADLSEQKVLKYCSLHMENYMTPKYIVFLSELPKTPNGKVDKRALRDYH